MTTPIEIACRDPIIARDGRPFGIGQGTRMRSLGWPLPSMAAGSLRSMLGRSTGRDFTDDVAQDLREVEVAGPLPLAGGLLHFPAPQDCVVGPASSPLRTVPRPPGPGGCDWPAGGLNPVGLTSAQAPEDFKRATGPAWWPADSFATWMLGEDVAFDGRFFGDAQGETRMHVTLRPETGAAEDGELFMTAALALGHLPRYGVPPEASQSARFAAVTLGLRVRAIGWCGDAAAGLDMLGPLGGERRLAHWRAGTNDAAWQAPGRIRDALNSATRVRMALATPAIFSGGWKPGWLGDDLAGTPPGADVRLRLVGVSIQRWRAVSGWSMANLPGQPRGPKPVRRLVPAGGVYFFEVAAGSAAGLADRWLEPISDDLQDRRDGFGLAVWGIW